MFDRTHKPIRLKPTTEAQSEQILILTSALRQLVVDLRRGDRITSNRIVIACQHSLTAVRVPALLQKLHVERDGIYVRLRSANFNECIGMLMSRTADVAIIYRVLEDFEEFGADFLEELRLGTDRLIPVFDRALPRKSMRASGNVEMPYISYPSDVFLGQVMERRVLPFLNPALQHIPKVETALTLAAVEMAAIGVGVAWVPQSLARDRLRSAALVDLSDVLPSCEMQVVAMRVQGKPNPAEAIFWKLLQSI